MHATSTRRSSTQDQVLTPRRAKSCCPRPSRTEKTALQGPGLLTDPCPTPCILTSPTEAIISHTTQTHPLQGVGSEYKNKDKQTNLSDEKQLAVHRASQLPKPTAQQAALRDVKEAVPASTSLTCGLADAVEARPRQARAQLLTGFLAVVRAGFLCETSLLPGFPPQIAQLKENRPVQWTVPQPESAPDMGASRPRPS